MKVSRRLAMQALGAGALVPAASLPMAAAQVPAPPLEGKDTPKICLEINGGSGGTGATGDDVLKRIKQLGINHVIGGLGGGMPWTVERLQPAMDRAKAAGLTIGNTLIGGMNNIINGTPGRDQEIENLQKSIVAAGKVGLPVIEYNWYVHRIQEGYFEEIDTERGSSGWTGFDYDREVPVGRGSQEMRKVRDLPPLPNQKAWKLEEVWPNITYFLKAVVPVAEKAGVRLALHPNDPPAPLSRGSQQIMGTLAGWKKLISIVDSPSNGITFDCGVTRELGEDPVEVARYFGQRDRINHVHFRNVQVMKPYERYREVWIDEGYNNMFAVMRELVKAKYRFLIYPEHPRRIDYDADRPTFRPQYPGGGGYTGYAFNVGYTRAMLQAAMSL